MLCKFLLGHSLQPRHQRGAEQPHGHTGHTLDGIGANGTQRRRHARENSLEGKIASAISTIAGGAIIVAAAVYFGMLDTSWLPA